MTSEIWYKSYQSRHDYTCIYNYQRLCSCIVSTDSEAYGMYLPLYISSTRIQLKAFYLGLIILDTIDLYGRISSTCTYFCTNIGSARIARDLWIQKNIYTIQYIYYTVAPATSQYAIVCKTQQCMYLLLYYISAVYA